MFDMDCNVANCIGAKKLVLHLWGGMTSDSNFQNNINAYPRLKEISEEYGLELLIENVVCNTENPMEHLCELKEKFPYVKFVFDTRWLRSMSSLNYYMKRNMNGYGRRDIFVTII